MIATGLFVGIVVGILGGYYNWGMLKTGLVAFVSSFILSAVLSLAHADDSKAWLALRASSVHISVGSGFIAEGKSGKRYLITNWHVCKFAKISDKVFGSRENGELIGGKVVKQDSTIDLCAAEIGAKAGALRLAPNLKPNTHVYTRGYPHGVLTESEGDVYKEIAWEYSFPIEEIGECPLLSAKHFSPDGILRSCTMTFHSVLSKLYSRPGSSGSPVVNASGELVGVISSEDENEPEYSAGMVRFEDVKAFLGAL